MRVRLVVSTKLTDDTCNLYWSLNFHLSTTRSHGLSMECESGGSILDIGCQTPENYATYPIQIDYLKKLKNNLIQSLKLSHWSICYWRHATISVDRWNVNTCIVRISRRTDVAVHSIGHRRDVTAFSDWMRFCFKYLGRQKCVRSANHNGRHT